MESARSPVMTAQSETPAGMTAQKAKVFARIASGCVFFVGVMVFFGWTFDIAVLKSILPGWPKVAPSTMLTFLLAAVSLWCAAAAGPIPPGGNGKSAPQRVAQFFSVAVAFIGICKLGDYALRWHLNFDMLGFREVLAPGGSPTQMAHAAALAFLLIGSALFLATGSRRFAVFQFLVLATALIGWLGCSSYLYGGEPLFPLAQMSAITAICFLLLSGGTFCLRADGGLMALILSDSPGGALVRKLLPWALVLPFLIGWLRLKAQQAGWFGTEAGLALFATSNVVLFAALIWVTAVRLHRTDLKRKQAEMASRQLAAIVESSDDAIIGKDLSGIVTSWNAGAENIFGYSAREMVGQPIARLIPPDRQHEETDILERIRHGENVRHFDTVRLRKDGSTIDLSVTVSAIKDSSGIIVSASKVARDITERKALEAERAKFVSLAENSVEFIGMCDLQGVPFFVNEAGLQLAGLDDLAQALRTPVTEFFFPEDQAFIGNEFLPRVQREGHAETEIRFRHFRTGEAIWMIYNVFVVRDAHGQPVAFATVSRDVTDRKRAELALRESEKRFRTMANSIPQLAWIARADGYIYWYNQRWYEYTGTTPEQMEGWDWQSVHDPAVLPKVMAKWAGAIESGEPFEMEFPLRGIDGQFRTFLTRVQPLKDSEGRVANWFGTNTDVEALKQAEQAIRKSEEYFRFLNDLVDATHTLADPAQIMAVMARMLGEHLGASRCAYADVEPDGEQFTILDDYTDGCASTVGSYQLSLFGARAVATLHGGQTLIIRNVEAELLPGDGADMFNAIGIKAIITCPLVKEGGLRAMMAVHQTTPRDWKPDEVSIVQEVVERCWATIERRTAEEKIHALNADLERRMEERTAALHASEARYRLLFNSIDEGFCTIEMIFDEQERPVDYRFLEINPSFERQTGLHDAVGKTMREFAPQHEQHWFETYGRIAVTGEAARFQNHAKELHRWYDVFACRFGEPQDRQVAIVFGDITERKAAEANIAQLNAELQQRAAELNSLFESLPGLYLVLTPDLEIVSASDAYLTATMTTREGIVGRNLFEVFPDNPDDPGTTAVAYMRASIGRVLHNAAPDIMAISKHDIRRPDGVFEERYWSPINSPMFGADRQIKYIVHRVEEVTEFVRQKSQPSGSTVELSARVQQMEAEVFQSSQKLQATNRELEAANKELEAYSSAVSHDLRVAEAADRTKSVFLATMSHELRTPLNSIIGFTGIVLQGMAGPLNPEQAKQLGMVKGSALHLLELINDVLDLSKIEAGQLEVHAEPFDLRASLERVTASIMPLADKKSLMLTSVVSPDLGMMVSDRRRVEQILINLLNNAVKFTESGSVTLTAERVAGFQSSPEAAPQPVLRLRVTDTGIGMKPEDLLTLFQPFRQIDGGIARQNEGTGLGLAISRRLAALLDGEVCAASEWSKGSVFTVILPMQGPVES
jgi:PAS domain S-box-containing protein